MIRFIYLSKIICNSIIHNTFFKLNTYLFVKTSIQKLAKIFIKLI
jgi:hypothetical protein